MISATWQFSAKVVFCFRLWTASSPDWVGSAAVATGTFCLSVAHWSCWQQRWMWNDVNTVICMPHVCVTCDVHRRPGPAVGTSAISTTKTTAGLSCVAASTEVSLVALSFHSKANQGGFGDWIGGFGVELGRHRVVRSQSLHPAEGSRRVGALGRALSRAVKLYAKSSYVMLCHTLRQSLSQVGISWAIAPSRMTASTTTARWVRDDAGWCWSSFLDKHLDCKRNASEYYSKDMNQDR